MSLSRALVVGQPLSKREVEVLELAAVGRSNGEIGGALGIGHRTVNHHMSSILAKLGADDRTAAAVKYLAGSEILYRSEERLLAIRRDIDMALAAIRELQTHTRETPVTRREH